MSTISSSSIFTAIKRNNFYAKVGMDKKEQDQYREDLPYTKRLNYSPSVIGGLNAFCWFSVAALADKCLNKVFKSKLNPKLMLPLEIVFGLLMGSKAYRIAKNDKCAWK